MCSALVKAWTMCRLEDKGHNGVLRCRACSGPQLRWPLSYQEEVVGKPLFHNSGKGDKLVNQPLLVTLIYTTFLTNCVSLSNQ